MVFLKGQGPRLTYTRELRETEETPTGGSKMVSGNLEELRQKGLAQ